MTAVKKGLSQRQAANRHGIPRRTLRNHLSSGITIRKVGRSSVLSPENEAELKIRIIKRANIGVPLTKKAMQCYVHE